MSDDHELMLDLRCPPRTVVFLLATGLPLVGLVATFFIAGWNDTGEQTLVLLLLGFLFALPAVQGIQERCQLSRGTIRKRHLGLWSSTALPSRVHFEASPDSSGYAASARRWLAAPPTIAIVDTASGKRLAEIGLDMLAGMTDEAYESLLGRLNGEPPNKALQLTKPAQAMVLRS